MTVGGSQHPFEGARTPRPPVSLRARVLAGIAREVREGEGVSSPVPTAGDFAIGRLWESGVARLAFAAATALLLLAHLAIGASSAPRLSAVGVAGGDWRTAFTAVRTSDSWDRLNEPF